MLVARSRVPLVGRREEQRRFGDVLDDASGGRARLIVVSGPAGIGKTRFLAEMRDIARSRSFDIASGRGLYYEDQTFQVLHGGLVQHIGEVLGQPAIAASDDEPVIDLDAGLERWRHARFDQTRALADLTVAAARRRPLLVTIDDASLADDGSLDVLERAAVHDVPLIVVLAVQQSADGLPARFERLISEGAIELRLPPLNRLETFELLRELGISDADQMQAAGNPLYLEIIARQQISASSAAPPTSVMDAYEEVLGTFPPATGALLGFLALVGDDIDLSMFGELTGLTTDQITDRLGPAVDGGVAEVLPDSVALRHPVVRGVVISRLTTEERRQLHLELSEAMEASELWSGLAAVRHLIQAGPAADGAVLAERASQIASEVMVVGLWHEAATLFEAAIAGAERSGCWSAAEQADVHRSAAVARVAEGDVRLAEQRALQAEALYADAGDALGAARSRVLRYRCLVFSGEFGVLLDRQPLLELAESDTLPLDLRLEALVTASELGWMTADHLESGRLAARAALLGAENGLTELAVRGLVSRSTSEWLQLDLHGSLATLDEALATAGSSIADQVVAAGRRSLNLWWLGRLEEAEAQATRTLTLAEQAQQPLERSIPLATRIAAAASRGEVGLAEELGYEAVILQRASDDRWAGNFFLPGLAGLAAARGDTAEALSRLEQLGEGSDGSSRELAALLEVHVRTVGGVATDDDRAIVEHLAGPDAAGVLTSLRIGTPAIFSLVIEAADLLTVGTADIAAAGVEEAMARGQLVTSTLHYLLPRVAGTAARLRGDLDQSVAVLSDAALMAANRSLVVEAARVELELAVSFAQRNEGRDMERAVAHARTATAEFARLGLRGLAALAERRLPGSVTTQLDDDPQVGQGAVVCVAPTAKYSLGPAASGGPSWQLVLHGQLGIVELAKGFGGDPVGGDGESARSGDLVVGFDRVRDAVEYGLRAVARARTNGAQVRVGVVSGTEHVADARHLAGAADGNRVLIDEAARRAASEYHALNFSPRANGFEVRSTH